MCEVFGVCIFPTFCWFSRIEFILSLGDENLALAELLHVNKKKIGILYRYLFAIRTYSVLFYDVVNITEGFILKRIMFLQES